MGRKAFCGVTTHSGRLLKSGRGLPQSKTLARGSVTDKNAERLGLRQPSGALWGVVVPEFRLDTRAGRK